jgi:hypothetical protein
MVPPLREGYLKAVVEKSRVTSRDRPRFSLAFRTDPDMLQA